MRLIPAAPQKDADKLLADLISEDTLAEKLERSRRTMRLWRSLGMPIAVRRGKLRLYDIAKVREWLLGQEPQPGRRRRA